MKGISEYTFAIFMGFFIALVLLALMWGWLMDTEEQSERERQKVISAAGCLADDRCEKQADNKACVHTIEGENECGCRAWLGIGENPDCAAGKTCVSPRGTNYGICN